MVSSVTTYLKQLNQVIWKRVYEDRNFNYLLKSQVPDFIKEEYPTFVTFLEKYYMFMDQSDKQGHSILNYTTDIDAANTAFLDKWRGALATDFPRSLKVDRASFYKRAKDFYEAKGSKQSIELFFRLLFGENVTVNYPGQYVLKPSAGIYSKERAIKIQESEHGGVREPLTLEGKKIDIMDYYAIKDVPFDEMFTYIKNASMVTSGDMPLAR